MGEPPSRRGLVRRALALGAGAAVGHLTGCASPTTAPPPSPTPATSTLPEPSDTRILLAYFSRPGENYWNGGRRNLATGNTEVLAGMIAERIDCDVFRIEALSPYSGSYDDTVARNAREQEADARPSMAGPLPDTAGYDTVILASPIWNVRPPMIMSTFAESMDLGGKTLLPVVTYAVSGLGATVDAYTGLAPAAGLGEGLAIRGEEANDAGARVDAWLGVVGLAG